MKIKNLKVGDTIKFNDGDVGVVVKKGRTRLHDHRYIDIKYFTNNYGNNGVFTAIQRYYDHDIVKGKKLSTVLLED